MFFACKPCTFFMRVKGRWKKERANRGSLIIKEVACRDSIFERLGLGRGGKIANFQLLECSGRFKGGN